MKQHFFGQADQPLFGVYHAPRGKGKAAPHAVLICPPIGHEYIRSHWCLRLMASQLSRKGIHVLRMDYRGIGDSALSVEDVASLNQWQDDVEIAVEHLKELSNCETVMVVGLRLGTVFAEGVARRSDSVNSVVLWEPVTDGAEYVSELREMHREMLDLWVCKMPNSNNDQFEEMVGSLYLKSLIMQIEDENTDYSKIIQPQLIVDSRTPKREFSHPEPSVQRVVQSDEKYNWNDLNSIETAWLRPLTTRAIVQNIQDMFQRLEKFDALRSPSALKVANESIPRGVASELTVLPTQATL